jgi:hypothetical protein
MTVEVCLCAIEAAEYGAPAPGAGRRPGRQWSHAHTKTRFIESLNDFVQSICLIGSHAVLQRILARTKLLPELSARLHFLCLKNLSRLICELPA